MARSVPVIEVLDSSPAGWGSALAPHATRARRLIAAFNRHCEADIAAVAGKTLARGAWSALKAAASGLHRAFERQHGAELDAIAEAVGLPTREVLAASLAYDLANGVGCSTLAVPTKAGPLHARNLDWLFPGKVLRECTTVVRVQGPAGPYALVTWPGFFGALTAVAPGRFSVSVNYVTHRDESDLGRLLARAATGHWPVSWVVRQALDEARDFDQALAFLRAVPLLSPVLFMVVGTRNGERIVIERSACGAALRRVTGPLLLTNHYASRVLRGRNGDLSEMDTEARYSRLGTLAERARPSDLEEGLEVLRDRALLNETTQHQVAMSARKGRLLVRVPGRRAHFFEA